MLSTISLCFALINRNKIYCDNSHNPQRAPEAPKIISKVISAKSLDKFAFISNLDLFSFMSFIENYTYMIALCALMYRKPFSLCFVVDICPRKMSPLSSCTSSCTFYTYYTVHNVNVKCMHLKPHCIRCSHFKVDDVSALEPSLKPPVCIVEDNVTASA
jgi:hypothetical protein